MISQGLSKERTTSESAGDKIENKDGCNFKNERRAGQKEDKEEKETESASSDSRSFWPLVVSEINKAVLPLHYSLPVSWLLLLLSCSYCREARQAWNLEEVSSTPVSLLVLIFIPLPVSSVISCSDTSTYLSLLSFLSVA